MEQAPEDIIRSEQEARGPTVREEMATVLKKLINGQGAEAETHIDCLSWEGGDCNCEWAEAHRALDHHRKEPEVRA